MAESSASVVDASAIAALRKLQSSTDPDFFNQLIDLFIEETPLRLAGINAAVDKSNPQGVAREAHALKGSSAHLGATRMSALCEILEEKARAGSFAAAPTLLSVLEEEFERVRKALTAEKNR